MSRPSMPNDPSQLPPSNIIIAVVLSLVILLGFNFIFDKPILDAKKAVAMEKRIDIEQNGKINAITKSTKEIKTQDRAGILEADKDLRISFQTEHLNVSISRKGGQIDDVSLIGYYVSTDREELVHLLSPENSKNSYVANFGWISSEQSSTNVPDNNTIWTLVENSEIVDNPDLRHKITLSWDNDQGLLFRKTITLDHDYMFTITQSVTNNGSTNTSLYPYSLLSRHGMPSDYMGFFILHEGVLGFINDEMEELDYDDLDRGENQTFQEQKGWIGFTDKYWFTGLIPDDSESKNTLRFLHSGKKGDDIYQTDIVGAAHTLPAGETISNTTRLYAGAKILSTLQKYEEKYGIPNLELAIDFGIYYFLTKPLFMVLTWLGTMFGHVSLGIILLTILLKTLTFPLSYKAYKSMAMVTKMQPKMNAVKEKYKDDREKLQLAFMELYQKEGVNPFSGCWPMLIQIPIFFSLYKVILTNIMLRHEPFWGWIDDLSAQDPTSALSLFGLLPFETPAMLVIGAWPCLMGLSMFMLNRMSPKPTDTTQALIKNYFPYMFTIMLARFASGLVIYWTLSNVLTILQQYVIMKRMGVPISLIHGHLGHLEDKDEDEDEKDDTEDKTQK